MRLSPESGPKRRYLPPTLRFYGTMASLTRTGSGSCVGGHYKRRKRKKRPWECDDD